MLPVVWTNNANPRPEPGFISFPSGRFIAAPNSVVNPESTASNARTQISQAPVLYGDSVNPSYDRAYRRWLPVASEQMLPDGSAYAYTVAGEQGSGINEIHVVDVATAVDTMIFNQGPYIAQDYEPEGIYLTSRNVTYGGVGGLWLLDPATRSLKAFPGAAYWAEVEGGVAWSSIWDGGHQFGGFDLATGVFTVWVDRSNSVPFDGEYKVVFLIGFDSSFHPLVEVGVITGASFVPSEVWLVSAPGQATTLSGPPPNIPVGMGVTDSHGTWFGATGGVYLYTGTGTSGPQLVADPPEAALSIDAQYIIAGACA
jgi:hypothetical protein